MRERPRAAIVARPLLINHPCTTIGLSFWQCVNTALEAAGAVAGRQNGVQEDVPVFGIEDASWSKFMSFLEQHRPMPRKASLKRFLSPLRLRPRSQDREVPPEPTIDSTNLSTLEEYQYSTLNKDRHEIRILRLDIITTASPAAFHCTLFHVSLTELPSFVALSYTWGTLVKTHHVFIDGVRYSVTANLYEALVHLYRAKFKWVWVDAICINQDDDDEKSLQIARLATIFNAAENVISWIGTHDEHTSFIFNAIKTRSLPHGCDKATALSNLSTALGELAKRPYWSRVWVLQEFAVARRVLLMCSEDLEDWDLVFTLVSGFLRPETSEGVLLRPFYAMTQVRKWQQQKQHVGLLELIISTASVHDYFAPDLRHAFKSSDIIDQIYGLLGLVNDQDMFVLELDYRLEINTLLQRMTRLFIGTTRQLDIVFLEYGKAEDSKDRGYVKTRSYAPSKLPWWCPDFLNLVNSAQNAELLFSVKSRQGTPAKLLGPQYRYAERSLCWDATAESRLAEGSYFLEDSGKLSVEGKLVGKVVAPSSWEHEFDSGMLQDGADDIPWAAWLGSLLFAYAGNPIAPLGDILEAMSSFLDKIKVDADCSDNEYVTLKRKLVTTDDPTDLASFMVRRLMKTTEASVMASTRFKSPEEINLVANSIILTLSWNYMRFRRKVAAYRPNDDDRSVSNVVRRVGAFGWVPSPTDFGDEIWLLEGCSMPIVLRRVLPVNGPGQNVFFKIGPAVVNGAMRGDMWSRTRLDRIIIIK